MNTRGKGQSRRWRVIALAVAGLLTLGGTGGATLGMALPVTGVPSVPAAHAHGVASVDLVPLSPAALAIGDAAASAAAAQATAPIDAIAFQEGMRKLWEDHITWTRLYIVSAVAELPDQELTAQRLLQNQTDIGDAVKAFYGEEAGNALTALLEEHILGAADLIAAAQSGDQAAIDTAATAWYANGDEIAAFLSAANPDSWPQAALQAEMKMHLDHTLDEATARLNGDYAADIAAYDAVHDHILAFADLLSGGIMAQFPDRFTQGGSN